MKFHSPFKRSQTAKHEIQPSRSGDIKPRVIIHAGFAKCGNSSIRATLFQNFEKLQSNGIFLFGKDLTIAHDSADLGTPIWSIQDAKDKGEQLTEKLAYEITALARGNANHISILSAENLANPTMPRLFAGLDTQFDVRMIFYLRPQIQWIPSAWKQWELKKGTSLSEFVSHCIQSRKPAFRLSIETWQRLLPAAKVDVRFLIPELLAKASPVQDFFHLLGLCGDTYQIATEPLNPSLDFAILHVLSKNPHLFSGVHDNKLMDGLTCALSKRFRSTNIQMLSREEETRIEECFRDENLWLLNTYCSGIDVNRIYRTYFTPQEEQSRYSSMTEIDLIYRCLGIILESIAGSSDLATLDESRVPRVPKQEPEFYDSR
jgi:hypothetical protein